MSEMEINDNPTTVDGVRAIEMRYRAIRETDTDNVAFYQSQMRLNSPSMGTLLPDRFLPVLDCTDQCISVFELALVQVMQAAAKFSERELDFNWISIYMPLRLLRKKDCADVVSQISEKYKTSPDKICFELPIALLGEKDSMCADSVSELRRRGFHVMLTEVGGGLCPMMRLADFDIDYAMLDAAVTKMLGTGERAESCIKSMISFINDLGAEPVASAVASAEQSSELYGFECSFYTGAYAGNFLLERYIRRKSAE